MHRDRGDISIGIHPPDAVKQTVLGKHGVRVLGQKEEQIILLAGHVGLLAVDPDPPALPVDLQPPDLQHLRPGLFPAAHQALVPLNVSLYPGHQFTGGEGLGHVVIRPQPQAPHLVNVVGQGRDDDDRGVLHLPQPPADLKAAQSRQHHIHNDQGIVPRQRRLEPLGTVGVQIALESAVDLQVIPLQLRHTLVVFNNQNFHHSNPSSFWSGR